MLLQVYFQEVSKVRAVARNLTSYRDPSMANSAAMWACLSALRVHETFKANLFREHLRISPKLTAYIITTCARRGDMLGIQEQSQKAATAASRADSASKDLRREFDSFVSTYNNWKRTIKTDGGEEPKAKKNRRGYQGQNNQGGGGGDDG